MDFPKTSFTTIDDPIIDSDVKPSRQLNHTEEKAALDYLNQLSPLEKLRLGYPIMGVEIKEPKSDCQRCHGRGYVSINPDTGEPRACPCILPPEMHNGNRAQRRAAAKAARKLKF